MSRDISLEAVVHVLDEIVTTATTTTTAEPIHQEVLNDNNKPSTIQAETDKNDNSNDPDASKHSCAAVRASKPRRAKFRVRFADDEGKDLFASKECPPSDVPPDLDVKAILKDAYVAPGPFGMGFRVARGDSTEKPPGKWAYTEAQPMDDYATFARIIESQFILAENIYLNNDKLICTIKVKCVKKISRVYARVTLNNWISFDDVDCNVIPMQGLGPPSVTSVLYQRYVFEKQLPPVPCSSDSHIVGQTIMFCFCVRFEDCEERWDNHFGRNYVIECVAVDNSVEEEAPQDMSGFTVVAHHMGPANLTEEEQRYTSQLKAMSPDYNYYNESSEFYW